MMRRVEAMLLGSAVALGLAGCSPKAVPAGGEATPATPVASAAAAAPVNTICPVTGQKVNPKITAEYKGKTYAFCCSDCVAKFKADPEKYAAGKAPGAKGDDHPMDMKGEGMDHSQMGHGKQTGH